MRPLPKLTPENEFFWTSGAEDVLRFQYCEGCDRYLHPPAWSARNAAAFPR